MAEMRKILKHQTLEKLMLAVKFGAYVKETWIFSTDFLEILKYQILMKIRLQGPSYFMAEGRTDRQIWRSW
jgi:hypothetical protein